MSMARRKIYRKEDKQISFFTSPEIHESIKQEAKRNKTSIKDYLVRLHLNATDMNSQDNLITETHKLVKRLVENQAFLVVPQQSQSGMTGTIARGMQSPQERSGDQQKSIENNDRSIPLSNQMHSTQQSQLTSRHSDQIARPSFDYHQYSRALVFPPKLEQYLSGITRTNTYETMRKVIFALLKLKEATHYEINQEIGHTTHNQPRALKRAVEDSVVFVDEPENPKEPYYYRINPSYL